MYQFVFVTATAGDCVCSVINAISITLFN